MGRTSGFVAVSVALMAVTALLAPASATDLGPTIDDEQDCLELVPAAASVTGVTDADQTISLDVLVLLDGVDRARGEEVIKKAAEPYAPLNITLDARYETVAFAPEEAGEEAGASTSTRLLEDMKKWTFGDRPADVDVVYLLTAKQISDAAGRADCIGGVRYADFAFAVGENYRAEDLLGVFYKHATAKIAGHEIGHLMGAHHHYANCVEGIPGAVAEVGPTPCSLMFNFLDFLSLRFGTLEGATIRGHAIEFASLGPDALPIRSATVDVLLSSGSATGTVASTDRLCTAKVDVRIQRYNAEVPYEEQAWTDAAAGRTRRNGTFRIKFTPLSGQYRAFVPEHKWGSRDQKVVCAQAASAPQTL